MKVKCTITMDLESGEYEILYNSLDETKKEIDYYEVRDMLEAIFADWRDNLEEDLEETEDDGSSEILH